MNSIKTRAIDDSFLTQFENELLQIKDLVVRDNTLDFELRGDRIIIYYRGSKLATVLEDGTIACNMAYCKSTNTKVMDKPDLTYFHENMPFYKQQIDWYLSEHKNEEKEVEQIIVKENNYSSIANSTDYYILDTEYVYKNDEVDARTDLLAVEWQSCQEKRKNNRDLTLSFIELKYGVDATKGSAGIKKHVEDFIYFCHHPEILKSIAADMEKVFEQKVKLELIPSFKQRKNWECDSNISINYRSPEMLFIFANTDPESAKIKAEIEECIKMYMDTEADLLSRISVVEASATGYGLYKYDSDKTKIRFKSLQEFYDTL